MSVGTTSCSVFGCGQRIKPLFRFPHPNKSLDRFQCWLRASGNPRFNKLSNIQIYKRGFICFKHFKEDYFIVGTRKLRDNSVPSLNLPADTTLHPSTSTDEAQPSIDYESTSPSSTSKTVTFVTPEKEVAEVEEIYKATPRKRMTPCAESHHQSQFLVHPVPVQETEEGDPETPMGQPAKPTSVQQVEIDLPQQDEIDLPQHIEINLPQQVEIDLPHLEENSNLQLVEEYEILQNLTSFSAKDIDIPETKVPYSFPKHFFRHRNYYIHDVEDTSEATKNRNSPCEVDNACTESESLDLIELELPVVEDQQTKISPELDGQPYFKSVKSYQFDSKRVTEVCRICFQSLDDEEVIKLYDEPNATRIKNMLKLVLPDLDLNIYPQTVICTKCSELLSQSYQLKETWLRTEEKLRKIIDKRKSVTNRGADLIIVVKKVEDEAEQTLNDRERTTTSKENVSNNILDLNTPNEIPSYGELNSDESVRTKSVLVSRNVKKRNLWGEGPYICELCGRLYQSVRSLQRHLRHHQKLPNEKNERKKTQRICEICGQLCFSLKSHLRIHIEHRCTICNKQYKCHSHLVTHMNVVHFKAGRSFQCHLCGKRYFYKTSLRLHLQTHKPKNQVLCNICNKRFSLPSYLRKHLMTHVQEKTWTCNYCGRTLKHEVNLHKHIEIFHKNKGRYICDICNKPFWKKSTLDIHKYRIHRIDFNSKTEQLLE